MINLATLQLNCNLGDIDSNVKKITQLALTAKQQGANIIITPELAITGYPPADLLTRKDFIEQALTAMQIICDISLKHNLIFILGNIRTETIEPYKNLLSTKLLDEISNSSNNDCLDTINQYTKLYNSCYCIESGKITNFYDKIHLAQYGIFDEVRYFDIGNSIPNYSISINNKNSINIVTSICADIWYNNLTSILQKKKFDIHIIINASPYNIYKDKLRQKRIVEISNITKKPIIYLNLLGGQDELIFDGGCIYYNTNDSLIYQCQSFNETINLINFNPKTKLLSVSDSQINPNTNPKQNSKSKTTNQQNSWQENYPLNTKFSAIATKVLLTVSRPNRYTNNMNDSITNNMNDSITNNMNDKIDNINKYYIKHLHQSEFVTHQDLSNETLSYLYHALVFSIRDYFKKNNFVKGLICYSSGIDSTLSSILTIDALGLENNFLLSLPSKFTSSQTKKDTTDFITINNISKSNFKEIDIDKIYHYLQINILSHTNFSTEDNTDNINNTAQQSTDNQKTSKTNKESKANNLGLENIQARIRAVLAMYVSNTKNMILINTSNKSELAVGYTTLYGDMCGSFAPLQDIYKTIIFQLAKWRNNYHSSFFLGKSDRVIPENIINKEPSAELKDKQKDSDNLPDYQILDKILECFIEKSMSSTQITKMFNYDRQLINKISDLLHNAEYKRYQATIGPKISDLNLNSEWRYPVTHKYKL